MGMRVLLKCVLAISICSTIALAENTSPVIYDFNDGHQGWDVLLPYNGHLIYMSSEGHPGGCMAGVDTVSGGDTLCMKAPDNIQGDLRWISSIEWDEYVYPNHNQTIRATNWWIVGEDGTRWVSDSTLGPLSTWRSRSLTMQESDWECVRGTLSFDEVMQNGTLAVSLECNIGPQPALESRIDNIKLIPEPASGIFLAITAIALIRRR